MKVMMQQYKSKKKWAYEEDTAQTTCISDVISNTVHDI